MEQNVRAFQCPSCGASLEPAAGTASMKCAYCGTSVVIPEDLRLFPSPGQGNPPPAAMDFAQLFARALRMGEVMRLARAGQHQAAAQLYAENTGTSPEQAGKIIEAIAEGKSIDEIDPSARAAAMQEAGEVVEAVREFRAAAPAPVRRPRRSSCSGTMAFMILAVALAAAAWNSTGPAHNLLTSLVSQFMLLIKR